MTHIDIPKKIKDYPNWKNNNKFTSKLKAVQNLLRYNNKYNKTNKDYICTLCKKQIKIGIYKTVQFSWDSILYHLSIEHKYKPNNDFINYIMNYNITIPTTIKRITQFNSQEYSINNMKYVKLSKNQLMIFDALMEHGGHSRKYHSYSKKKLQYRHSEHSGLLDFDNTGLERVIVSGKTDRKDPADSTILLPENMPDAIDYEYIFHTHPPTPKPGGRVTEGILYEFPSISDIFHFIDHFNDGITQGSLIITPEGIYNLRKIDSDGKQIDIDETKIFKKMIKTIHTIQDQALAKYSKTFSEQVFYSKIAQDKTFIGKFNTSLEEFGITADFFPRSKDKNGKWILKEIYLPVSVVEKKLR
jgi:hypothetical protein